MSEVVYAPRPEPAALCVHEPAPDPLSEAELALLWEGQRFPPPALTTPDGSHVEVAYPGHRGSGPGPDFRDAVVRLGGEERRGDVELHVRASAFRGHGHHLDPAYDGVVLHVVYLVDTGPVTTLSSGADTPVVTLAPWLSQRTADLTAWLEGPPRWQEPCRDALARLGEHGAAAAVLAAGRERFATKVERLRAAAARDGAEAALWQALLDALAYGGDRGAFGRLAQALPPSLARTLTLGLAPREAGQTLTAALLAVAGLVDTPPALATALPPPIRPPPQGASRPAARPERRLEALARLWIKAAGDLAAYAIGTVETAPRPATLINAWQVAGLGRERTSEIVLNVVLPFAAQRPELRPRAEALLTRLTATAPYGRTAFLERNLVRPDGRRLARTALLQQGLLTLLDDWCSQGGCGRCPLS